MRVTDTMAQQLLQPESVLLTSSPLPLDLITKVSSLSRIQLKELGEGTPQSPLTESSTSSQESSAAELLEHSSARSILALGSKSSGFSPHTDLDLLTPSPGSGSSLERHASYPPSCCPVSQVRRARCMVG